jgi:AcrR family transcriptional regulator
MTLSRPLRADAERNRHRILAAAEALFAERGIGVSIDDIAAAAGVGVGTMYRRFPDRDALIEALFEEKIASIAQRARDALAIEDPWEGFVTFMRGAAREQATNRGLKDVLLSPDRGRERVAAIRDTIRPIASQLLRRAQEAGTVREDLRDFDMPMLQLSIALIADQSRDVAPEYYERLLTVFLDGLARERSEPTPMHAPPLEPEQFLTIMSRRR